MDSDDEEDYTPRSENDFKSNDSEVDDVDARTDYIWTYVTNPLP